MQLACHIVLDKITALLVGFVFCEIGTLISPLAGGLASWTSQPSLVLYRR
jgi:hypothetical protein